MFKNPWLLLAIGLLVGFMFGRISKTDKPTNSIADSSAQCQDSDKKDDVADKQPSQTPDLSLCPREYARVFIPLEPPSYHPELPEKLATNYVGEVKINWLPVDNAARYHVVLFDENGKEARVVKTSRTVIFLKELPFDYNREFTPFTIALRTENERGVLGELGPKRELIAQRLVNITAPGVKEIRVEE